MTSALVVGEPNSGRTTFVGLLYTAVVRFGTEEADRFRFSAERESIRRLEAIYGALGSGRFPEADLLREDEPLRFVFGFRRSGFGRLPRPGGDDEEFDAIPVHVGGMAADEVAELGAHAPVLDDPTRRLLQSSVVIALINAAAVPPAPGGIDGLPIARYDLELAGTLETVARYLALQRARKARRLYPLFVLTQFDRIPEATLRAFGAPAGEPTSWSKTDRAAFGSQVLDTHLPETSRFLNRGREARVVTAPPTWFFSELALEQDRAGETRIRRRSRIPLGGWEPEYPYEEYRALLLELAHRARLAPVVPAG